MKFFTKAELYRATPMYESHRAQEAKIISASVSAQKTFDIFLSHRFEDRNYILALYDE